MSSDTNEIDLSGNGDLNGHGETFGRETAYFYSKGLSCIVSSLQADEYEGQAFGMPRSGGIP